MAPNDPTARGASRHSIPLTGAGLPHGETRTVRPYAVTGGRIRPSVDLPIEALVEMLPGAVSSTGLTQEQRAILYHSAHDYISIAELSALLRLPIGVVRVLVNDLADAHYVKVHVTTPVATTTGSMPALSLSVLESVLNGISTL